MAEARAAAPADAEQRAPTDSGRVVAPEGAAPARSTGNEAVEPAKPAQCLLLLSAFGARRGAAAAARLVLALPLLF